MNQCFTRHKKGAACCINKLSRARNFSEDLRCGGGADVLLQHARNRTFGSRADNALFFVTVLKQNQGGNTFDPIALRNRRSVVHIQFHDTGSSGVFVSDGFDRWREHAARRAPRCPKIDQHRPVTVQNISFKTSITNFSYVLAHYLGSLKTVSRFRESTLPLPHQLSIDS